MKAALLLVLAVSGLPEPGGNTAAKLPARAFMNDKMIEAPKAKRGRKPGPPKQDQDRVTLKLSELRACSATASIITRKNYVTMLESCPPDMFQRIIERLFAAAQTDQTGQAAFAALQYLIGKPIPINNDRNAALEDMRALARLHISGSQPSSVDEAKGLGENTERPSSDGDHIITD